jgi:hypothetical protein
MSHELTLTRPKDTAKNGEHSYLKFVRPSVEKILNLLHGFK